MQPFTCLFAGGGTGGHLTPGLAVAAALRRAAEPCRIVFVGSGRPIERRIVQEAGYEHVELPVESTRILRRNPLRFIRRNWQAYRHSKDLLDSEQPRAVIGLGGIASVPLVLAANRRTLPTLLLEQNTIPGRANRFLSRRAGAICITFPQSESRFPNGCRTIVTGNPVRPEIAALHDTSAEGKSDEVQSILVLGGSQGASGLNDGMVLMVAGAPDQWRGRRIVHQTGAADCERIRAAYATLNVPAQCEPFFGDMATCYREATLVVSRAGATTLAELACAGLPAVLVPYPQAAHDHQLHNAEHFERTGASQTVRQSSNPAETAERISTCVDPILAERERLSAMRQAMRDLARPDAAQRVVEVLQSLMAGNMKSRGDGT